MITHAHWNTLQSLTQSVLQLTLMLCPILFATFSEAETPLLATQLSQHNAAQLRIGGPDAIGGINDWLVSNGTTCVVISDIEHDTGITPAGGSLIDVGHCGKKNDQWTFNHVLPNMNPNHPLRPVDIHAYTNKHQAKIIVDSQGDGIQVESHYQLDTINREQLTIEHRLTRTTSGKAMSLFGAVTLHPNRVLTPFVISTQFPQYTIGFNQIKFDRKDKQSALAAMLPADLVVLVGDHELQADISYGLQFLSASLLRENGEKKTLPIFAQSSPTFTLLGTLTQPPWFSVSEKLGMLEFMQTLLMDLAIGDQIILKQRLILSEHNDVASITDKIYQGRIIKGKLDSHQARISVTTRDNRPITHIKPDKEGNFKAILPKGIEEVQLVVITPWQILPPILVNIQSTQGDIGLIKTPAPSYVKVRAINPMRLVFKGINGTPDPDFHDNLTQFSVDGKIHKDIQSANDISLAGIDSDTQILAIKPGSYKVFATRGLEFSVETTQVTIDSGKTHTLNIAEPRRELQQAKWLSSDFHVHSAPSFDSSISVAQRLISFAAQGGQILIASEHNRIVDVTDELRQLNLEDEVAVITGIELTGLTQSKNVPHTYGHANIFPLRSDPLAFAGGLPIHEGRRLRDHIAHFKTQRDDVVFQLNHPRSAVTQESDNFYFEHLINNKSFDPSLALEHKNNHSLIHPDPITGLRDIDIDLIEIANGSSYQDYLSNRRDWFSLLKQGEKIFASANSDTHGNRHPVAIPRNYVFAPEVSLEAFDQNTITKAINRGSFYGTTGPLLQLTAKPNNRTQLQQGQLMGKMISTTSLELDILITAASWVPVDTLNLYINGELYLQRPAIPSQSISIPLHFTKDSFIVIEATGMASELYHTIAPKFTPFAFTNPIFIDADNDNEWNAPGL
jgi:hypothetical protein